MTTTEGKLVQLGKRPAEPAPAPVTAAAPGKRLYVETYGCQMNVADSDLLTSILRDDGYATTASAMDADVVVINTCAVREKAEERVVARAAELGALKRARPGLVLAIVGCMAEHLKEGLAERVPTVDVIAGPDSYRRVPGLLRDLREQRAAGTRAVGIDVKLDRDETYEGAGDASVGDGVSTMITIQRGCDKFCTFCVVPFTRGRERGVAPREVLRQVRHVVAAGVKEVTLLGQTVNSYAWEDVRFADLLRSVAAVPGLERVRFTSPYPVDFTDDVIAAIADHPKICSYVHLPLQSGSDDVLARMKRGYTIADFRAIVARLRSAVPDIALSTDILSGFCGETEADHQATLALMREVRFDSAFMFSYSERDLTFAAKKLVDDVPALVKKRRLAEIVAVQEELSAAAFAAQVGRQVRVLVHGPSKRNPREMMARTDGFKTVILPADVGRPGDLLDVVVQRSTMATLFGTPVGT